MKIILSMLSLLCLLTFAFVGCTSTSAKQSSNSTDAKLQSEQVKPPASKTLVVYYSRSSNTKAVAEQIQRTLSADILEIKTVQPYPQDYRETTTQAKKEIESGFKPQLQPVSIDLNQYDTIILGSPIWWGNVATPVTSFLTQNPLAGKTVLLFVTHGGSGIANSLSNVKQLCPTATVKEALAIRSSDVHSSQNNINQWLQRVGIIK